MIDREKLEREVAALIREHAGIGYKFKFRDGTIDPESLFIVAGGAAHIVVHHLLAATKGTEL